MGCAEEESELNTYGVRLLGKFLIAFSCQQCGKRISLKPEFAGRKTACWDCKAPFVMVAQAPPSQTALQLNTRTLFDKKRLLLKQVPFVKSAKVRSIPQAMKP
jgi:hypothetical protein